MKCTCDNSDNESDEKRWYISPVVVNAPDLPTEADYQISSTPTTYTITMDDLERQSKQNTEDFWNNSNLYWLDLKTSKKIPLK